MECFQKMQRENVDPDKFTFILVLKACTSLMRLQTGKEIHLQIIKSGCEKDIFVGSCLIDMYAKCGSIEDASKLFNSMPFHDVVSWTAMISGYVKCGQGEKAIELFQQMWQSGVWPNSITYLSILNACASVAALAEGKFIHMSIIKNGLDSDVTMANSLIDMYFKCGNVVDAIRVFNSMSIRDTISWNTMLVGYGMHGLGKEALVLFELMSLEGVESDNITFISLLSACNHAGLVDEGLYFFECLSQIYGISATADHYTCMVDLLGRCGLLDEAENTIRMMPFQPNVSIYMALLCACRMQGNLQIGEIAARKLMQLDPEHSSTYTLLSNVYAAIGKWENKEKIQQLRTARHVRKPPGQTWIEVNNRIHTFFVDDMQHPQIVEIRAELNRLYVELKEAGYIPAHKFPQQVVAENGNVSSLCHHSEKLAIAFGLISTPPGTPLRIFKNLRVCEDCHIISKFISKIAGRSLIVRDANRFHHFKNGICSCGDYW